MFMVKTSSHLIGQHRERARVVGLPDASGPPAMLAPVSMTMMDSYVVPLLTDVTINYTITYVCYYTMIQLCLLCFLVLHLV